VGDRGRPGGGRRRRRRGSLPFPADATVGAGAVHGNDAATLVLAGGFDGTTPAPARSLDLRCDADCVAVELEIDLGVALDRCEAFATTSGTLLLLGDDGARQRVLSIDLVEKDVVELDLRERRRGAVAVPTPNGTLSSAACTRTARPRSPSRCSSRSDLADRPGEQGEGEKGRSAGDDFHFPCACSGSLETSTFLSTRAPHTRSSPPTRRTRRKIPSRRSPLLPFSLLIVRHGRRRQG
jgi:hypothetical protein